MAAAGDPRWLEVVAAVSDWVANEMDCEGRIAFAFPYPHTYRLEPPWYSAMAQGEAASLLSRAAVSLNRPELAHAAQRAVSPLLSPGSLLIAETNNGPVLQEYPTDPPATRSQRMDQSLWGLYDIAIAEGELVERRPSGVQPRYGRAGGSSATL